MIRGFDAIFYWADTDFWFDETPVLTKEQDLVIFNQPLPAGKPNVTTIHLFGSCPMGDDPNHCAVDSFGKVYAYNNVYVNDASILPGAPSVNPQGTIMALARRNTVRFLE